MAVFFATEEVDLIGAHFEDDRENPHESAMYVWYAPIEEEMKNESPNSSDRGVHTTVIEKLHADDGLDEILNALGEVPNSRIRGGHRWAEEARAEDSEKGGDN
ncbi:hypothetical protein [Halorubellus salinus]|uniref:hypothetical protein n=1 Tax=Halorubellus salinus TaxID=755309 RepID=UPI001D06AFCC|nr:hypothetical protein [Halorubellus salinus]